MGLLVAAVFILAFVVLMVTGLPSSSPGGVAVSMESAQGPVVGPGPSTAPVPAAAPGSVLPGPQPGGGGVGGVRRFSHYSRGRGYRDWRTRGDPTLINSLWRSRQPLGIRKQLGNAEVYIVLALLIGFVTVVIGCWLSDNCWSPEPEHVVTLA